MGAPDAPGAPPAGVRAVQAIWLGHGESAFVVFCRMRGGVPTSRLYRASSGAAYADIRPVPVPVWSAATRRTASTLDLPGEVHVWSTMAQITHQWQDGRCELTQRLRLVDRQPRLVLVTGARCPSADGRTLTDREAAATLFQEAPTRR